MLKRILSTILAIIAMTIFALAPTTAQAQNEPEAVYFGVLGGFSQATLDGGDVSSSSFQSGFTGGVSFTYNVNEAFSVQLETIYAERGGKGIDAAAGPSRSDALDYSDATIEVSYIEIPVLFKLTAPIEAVKVRGFAGPAVSSLLNATINGRENQAWLQSNSPVEDRFSPVDLNGIIGGEIAVPLPRVAGEVAIDGRYYLGFVNVDREGFSMKNRTFSGTLSVRFAL